VVGEVHGLGTGDVAELLPSDALELPDDLLGRFCCRFEALTAGVASLRLLDQLAFVILGCTVLSDA
jgi:hypothetical protein